METRASFSGAFCGLGAVQRWRKGLGRDPEAGRGWAAGGTPPACDREARGWLRGGSEAGRQPLTQALGFQPRGVVIVSGLHGRPANGLFPLRTDLGDVPPPLAVAGTRPSGRGSWRAGFRRAVSQQAPRRRWRLRGRK